MRSTTGESFPSNVTTPEQKRDLIQGLTDQAVSLLDTAGIEPGMFRIPGIVSKATRELDLAGDWQLQETEKNLFGRKKTSYSLLDKTGERHERRYDWVADTSVITSEMLTYTDRDPFNILMPNGWAWTQHTVLKSDLEVVEQILANTTISDQEEK